MAKTQKRNQRIPKHHPCPCFGTDESGMALLSAIVAEPNPTWTACGRTFACQMLCMTAEAAARKYYLRQRQFRHRRQYSTTKFRRDGLGDTRQTHLAARRHQSNTKKHDQADQVRRLPIEGTPNKANPPPKPSPFPGRAWPVTDMECCFRIPKLLARDRAGGPCTERL